MLFVFFFVAFSLITYVLFGFWFSFVEQEVDEDNKPLSEQTTSSSAVVTKGKFFSPLYSDSCDDSKLWSM